MVEEFESSSRLAHLSTLAKVISAARHVSEKGPPHVEEARRELKKDAAKRQKEQRAQEQRARAKRPRAKPADAISVGSESDEDQLLADRRGRGRGKGRLAGRTASSSQADEAERSRVMQRTLELKRVEEAHAREVAELTRRLNASKEPEPPPAPPQLKTSTEPAVQHSSPPLPPPVPRQEPTPLPTGWKVAQDAAGRTYYYNKHLGASQYNLPTEDPSSPPLPPPQSAVGLPPPQSAVGLASSSASSSGANIISRAPIGASSYEDEQRRGRIVQIRAMLPFVDERREKAELVGELAALERQEHAQRGYSH